MCGEKYMDNAGYIKKYIDFLSKYLLLESSIKIVVDCSNGTIGRVLREVERKYTALDMVFINDEEDGTFPAHNPGPLVAGAMDQIMDATKNENADVGVIFDPDGDRIFFVDNEGHRIDPREIFCLMAPSFDPPYAVNVGLGKKTLEWTAPNLDVIETKTGHYFIKQLMKEKDVSFGIEHSGHYYFKDFFYADSGILPMFIVLSKVSAMKKRGSSLSEWRKSIPQVFSTSELNFEIEDKEAAIKKVKNYFSSENIYELDGITIEGNSFWLNVRTSNTEPLLRANLAANSKDIFEEKKIELFKLLREN